MQRRSWRADNGKVTARAVVVASADAGLRERLRAELAGLRWTVTESTGGADAMAKVEAERPEALVVDSWLPDLEVSEFAGQMGLLYRRDGCAAGGWAGGARSGEEPAAERAAACDPGGGGEGVDQVLVAAPRW